MPGRRKTYSDANLKAVRYVLDGHRARHGWHRGWVWTPSAWTKGQGCGCGDRHPCGWYTNPRLGPAKVVPR